MAAALPEPPPTITVSWNANAETNITGYFVLTNGAPLAFTNGLSITRGVAPVPMSVTVIASNSVGLVSQPSAPVLIFQPDPPRTNVATLSCQGVSIWQPVAWTNPPGTKLFKVVYPTSTKARVEVSTTTAHGPWSIWTNWPTAITTNRQIGLRVDGRTI